MHTTFVRLQKAQHRIQIDSLRGPIHTDDSHLSMAVVFDQWGMSLFVGVLLSCVLLFQLPLCGLATCASFRPYPEPSGPPSCHEEAVPQQADDCPTCILLAQIDFSGEIPASTASLPFLQFAWDRRVPEQWKNPGILPYPLRDFAQPRLNVQYSTFLL